MASEDKKNKNILDIVNGISQVMANSQDTYPGPDTDGEEREKIGLKREVDNPINQSRELMDGFACKIKGHQLVLTYSSDIRIEDIHKKGFENEVEQTVGDIASYIKKEFKKITGKALSLSPDGEIKILVQNTSRIKTFFQATKIYNIGGLEAPSKDERQEQLDKAIKKFHELAKDAKRPKNELIKPKDNQLKEKD